MDPCRHQRDPAPARHNHNMLYSWPTTSSGCSAASVRAKPRSTTCGSCRSAERRPGHTCRRPARRRWPGPTRRRCSTRSTTASCCSAGRRLSRMRTAERVPQRCLVDVAVRSSGVDVAVSVRQRAFRARRRPGDLGRREPAGGALRRLRRQLPRRCLCPRPFRIAGVEHADPERHAAHESCRGIGGVGSRWGTVW